MALISLSTARLIVDSALAKSASLKLKPVAVVVLDVRGALKAFAAEDGTSLLRGQVAHGKAYGAIAFGSGTRALMKRAQEQPYFVNALSGIAQGAMVPVPGGVLIRGGDGELLGSVGVSGDTSDNDEACAVAGIESAGLKAEVG